MQGPHVGPKESLRRYRRTANPQGCCVAPLLFNLFFGEILQEAIRGLEGQDVRLGSMHGREPGADCWLATTGRKKITIAKNYRKKNYNKNNYDKISQIYLNCFSCNGGTSWYKWGIPEPR